MEKSRRFMKIASCHSLFGKESDIGSVVSSVGNRSKSLESVPRQHKRNLKPSQSASSTTLCGDVKDGDSKDILGDTTEQSSTTSDSVISVKSVRALPSMLQHYEEKQYLVSSCPTVSVQRLRQDFAQKWSSLGIPTALSIRDTTDDSSDDSTDGSEDITEKSKGKSSAENHSGKSSRENNLGTDFSCVFRERSVTWAGEDIRPYKSKSLYSVRSTRSDGGDNSVLVYFLDNPRDRAEHFLSEYRKTELRPCICSPSQPPSVVCSTLEEEEDEENRMIYLKQLMLWVTFFIKLILFTSLWVLLLYWFLMSAGFVNITPRPIVLQQEWNTFIEKEQDFKWMMFNNTFDSAELEVRMQGPFADSNVFFNCQFERLYFLNDKFNRSDVKIDDAEAVEVDHRIYEDSYSAITSTTTRRTMTYTTTIRSWYMSSFTSKHDWLPFVSWIQWSWTYKTPSRTRSMTWWTFTTLTARLTRYNLSRHPMTSFTVQEPYNFVPWDNVRTYGYTFRNFKTVGGRLHGHRHYANVTPDSNMTVIYGLKYMLNMTSKIEFLNNTDLDTIAFAIEITKGMGITTTTTTPPPPVVIKRNDGVKYGLILVGLILALLFLQTNRVLALFVMAVACASILSFLQIRPAPEMIVTWLNLDYIFELMFVMMLVAVTSDTGFYDFVSFTIYKLCLGSIFGITFILCVCAFTLSVFMDSVAAILFVTPIAIRTVEQGQMNPMPVLMSMILFSNMASVLDADYNYVNYNIIKGYDKWQATEVAFKEVKFHQKMIPGVIASALATTVYLIGVFRLLKPHVYTLPEVATLMHRQTLLRIAASGVNRNSKNWNVVRAQLIEWHHEIDQERLRRLADIGRPPKRERFNEITDMFLLMKVGLVIIIFFVLLALRRHNVYELGKVSIGMIVVACTGYLLILINLEDLNGLLKKLQWCTIIGFISIFFIERSFETFRFNKRIFQFLSGLLPDDKSEVPFTIMRYLQWASFAMSAIFNNFGAVTTMRLVARRFGDMLPDRVADFVYAVTFGCNVGGSATALGTGVAIACTASAWQQGYRVSACKYIIFMLPITLINMLCVYFIWAGLGS